MMVEKLVGLKVAASDTTSGIPKVELMELPMVAMMVGKLVKLMVNSRVFHSAAKRERWME